MHQEGTRPPLFQDAVPQHLFKTNWAEFSKRRVGMASLPPDTFTLCFTGSFKCEFQARCCDNLRRTQS